MRVRGSAGAGGSEAWAESGESDIGPLPVGANGWLRCAAAGGGTCRVATVGLGAAGGVAGAAVTGAAAVSGWSP